MDMKRGEASLNLLRCPSMISTTDGGLTPLTDLSSPLVRSPQFLTSDYEYCASVVASTNLLRLSMSGGYRIDEYSATGSTDLLIFAFDSVSAIISSSRILLLPNGDSTTLVVITNTPAIGPVYIEGMLITHLQSHHIGCACRICMRALSQVIDKRGAKIGKYETLFTDGLPVAVSRPIIAVPAQRVKLIGETGGLCLACDSLVKWIPWGKQSVADVLGSAAMQGKTRVETNLLVSQTWVYTIYNGRPYRIKKVWFDMTPLSTFFDKKSGKTISFAAHIEQRYGVKSICVTSPMIEAVAEKRSETCFLIPELCFLLRPAQSSVPMHTVHAQTRTSDRSILLESILDGLEIKPQFQKIIELNPVEVEGTILSPPVSLSLMKRNHHQVNIRWSLVLIGCSVSVSPSLLVGCAPTVILTCGSSAQAAAVVVRRAAQGADLVLVVLKTKSSIYATVKYVSLVECGVPCQVVLADTLNRECARDDLIYQIKSKCLKSWDHSGSEHIVALDFHRFGDVSVFSIAWTYGGRVEVDFSIDQSGVSLGESDMMSRYFNLLVKNIETLPLKPIIVLACRRGTYKSSGVDDRLKNLFSDFSLVIACVKSEVRLFSRGGNVSPGFTFDVPGGFYLVPHRVQQGNALPLLYLIVYQHMRSDVLRNVIWRSYGSEQIRRLPDLFRHTLKLSELIGIQFRKTARDLNKCLENSPAWKNLKKSYFYL